MMHHANAYQPPFGHAAPGHNYLSLGTLCVRVSRALTAPHMYPTLKPPDIKAKVKTSLLCLAKLRQLRAWHEKAANPVLAEMVTRHPFLPILSERPYINGHWSAADRMHVVETHYGMLGGARAILRFPSESSVELASLNHVEDGLSVVLDKPIWFFHEGEIALNLFAGKQRAYSLVFTLGALAGGRRVAYVGAVQGGASGPEALERNKSLTRAAHGMRPRDLLFASFRMLSRRFGVSQILAVSDDASIARSKYGNPSNTFFSYDAAWTEYGGVASAEAGFYDVPTELGYREPQEIPARKRALYRRRYDMLRDLEAEIAKCPSPST